MASRKGIKNYRVYDIGNMDIYKYYLKETKKIGLKRQRIDKYRAIINDFNLWFSDQILEGKVVSLPNRLGRIHVKKIDKDFSKPRNVYRYKLNTESKEQGVLIIDTSPYEYKFIWKRHEAIITNRSFYEFKACREMKTGLRDKIRIEKKDYI